MIVRFTTTYVFSVYHYLDCIGGVLVKVIASSALDREFEQSPLKSKNVESSSFSAKHAALNGKNKY